MSNYILFNKSTGEIVHIHREFYMDSNKTIELSEKEVLQQVGEFIPEGIEVSMISVDESPQPKRGYRYYVDLTTNKLMLVERPIEKKEV